MCSATEVSCQPAVFTLLPAGCACRAFAAQAVLEGARGTIQQACRRERTGHVSEEAFLPVGVAPDIVVQDYFGSSSLARSRRAGREFRIVLL